MNPSILDLLLYLIKTESQSSVAAGVPTEDRLEQMQQVLLAKQDALRQELREALMGLPQLVTTMVQYEMGLRQLVLAGPPIVPGQQPVVLPAAPPAGPPMGLPALLALALGPALAPALKCPKELLDATYDGDLEKLAFFTLQVRKFLRDWGHLFLTDEHHVDYIGGKLREQAADWYVALNNVQSPELQTVGAFMRSLQWRYEDPKGLGEAGGLSHERVL
ncbi:UNVERIFIED_CONTAM: hypothetical protein K2H54_009947 [Gekko kuhli]